VKWGQTVQSKILFLIGVLTTAINDCVKKVNDKMHMVANFRKSKKKVWEWVYAKVPNPAAKRLRVSFATSKGPKNSKKKKKVSR